MKVLMFKMPFKTNHFNKNQKVWIQNLSGAMAARVAGRFRGAGRYVYAWVKWEKALKDESLMPKMKEFEVDDNFVKAHHLLKRS